MSSSREIAIDFIEQPAQVVRRLATQEKPSAKQPFPHDLRTMYESVKNYRISN